MSPHRKSRRKRSPAPSFVLEEAVRLAGYRRVAGVDEAGRGCLAGPVVAAAVLLTPGQRIRGVRDSKLLALSDREKLAVRIGERAISIGYGICTVEEIDRMNILRASLEAMRRALIELDPPPDFALIDGNQPIHSLPFPHQVVIDGDALCHAIAAASVLAKVKRDAVMRALHIEFPGYRLSEHKGYATKAHFEALALLGPAPCHRRSFRLGTTSDDQVNLFSNA